jgi:translocation and assembly module TamA
VKVRCIPPAVPLVLLIVLLLALPLGAAAQDGQRVAEVGPGLPTALARVVEEAIARFTLGPEADEADEERELRRAERAAREALATEGHFSPKLRFEPVTGNVRYRLLVEPGPLTRVGALDLSFTGAITEPRFAERVAALRAGWPLAAGAPFRSADWEAAKTRLLLETQTRDFAGAALGESSAEVDAERALATLKIRVDSGPAYTVGPLQIDGLERFEAKLVERFNPFRVGDPFDRARMLEFQQALQETPYFASAIVTLQLDPTRPEQAPLHVEVREARTRRFSVGVGYATNTGAHVEFSYRQSLTFGHPYALLTGMRIDQTGGFAFADLVFPPRPGGARDSVGVLVEDSDIENLRIKRWGVGAARSTISGPRTSNNVETRLSINYEDERRKTPLEPWNEIGVLSSTYNWMRRDVDDVTNPRTGHILRLEGTVGASGAQLDDTFVRGYARYVRYLPISQRDALTLRAEVGAVAADSADVVPTKFLFRTGGSTTVRGYDFESLGVSQGGAIVGGRALAVASVEYVHWFERWPDWGIAAFVDAGDAADRFNELDPAVGVGLGARWRTVAGPLALDVAWGERDRKVRVHFSVAIAF